jgi:hypothetical protein
VQDDAAVLKAKEALEAGRKADEKLHPKFFSML